MKKSKADAYATMQNLLELARMHFTKRGYAGASMEELVAEAKVTRGALYHHFSSKRGCSKPFWKLCRPRCESRGIRWLSLQKYWTV